MASITSTIDIAEMCAGPDYLTNQDRMDATTRAVQASTEIQGDLDILTQLAAQTLRVPVALACLVEADRQCFVGATGLTDIWAERRETPLSHSFCQHVVTRAKPFIVEDARNHPLVKDNLAILDLNVEAYAGIPLILSSGHCVGSFCAIDIEPREWSGRELETLHDFSRLATTSLNYQVGRQLQDRLSQHVTQFEKMDALGRFAGGIVHDFNNLLMAIQGCVELGLMHKDHPFRTESHFRHISAMVDRGARLTSQLLAFCRREHPMPQEVDLDKAMQKLKPMFNSLLPDRITLEVKTECKCCQVYIDPGQLDQILVNLVLNSRDAMDKKSGRISIRTRCETLEQERRINGIQMPAGEYAVLSVEDDGSGIQECDLGKIFDPFFSTKDNSRGIGLGLSTVFGIVRGGGGSIVVDTDPGTGTTFHIWLPVHSQGLKSKPVTPAACPSPRKRPNRMLILEDDAAILKILVMTLRNEGIKVLEAGTGQEAMEQAQSHEDIDVLLTDIQLPDANGIQVAQDILQFHPEISVAFMSGDSGDQAVTCLPEDRLLGVLQKPFRISELLNLWSDNQPADGDGTPS